MPGYAGTGGAEVCRERLREPATAVGSAARVCVRWRRCVPPKRVLNAAAARAAWMVGVHWPGIGVCEDTAQRRGMVRDQSGRCGRDLGVAGLAWLWSAYLCADLPWGW